MVVELGAAVVMAFYDLSFVFSSKKVSIFTLQDKCMPLFQIRRWAAFQALLGSPCEAVYHLWN